MPSVTLNRKTIESYTGKISVEKLKHAISFLGTDLDDISGDVIDVEVFPNRPDWLCEQGLGRSLAAILGKKTGLIEIPIKKSGKKVIVDKNVTMRPYTACAIVKNITFTDDRIKEIMQIQEKLALTHGRHRKKSAYGLYPITNVAFPISYTAKDPKTVTFWPLGMKGEMRADDVEELHPKGREYKWLAEGWKKYPFFIDAKDKVMCMLPYTNSHDTGKIDEHTKEVFIECTGTDFENVSVALNIFVTMLADMGGDVYSVDIEYDDKTITTPNMTPSVMMLSVDEVNTLLGLSLGVKDVVTYLEQMSYGIKSIKKGTKVTNAKIINVKVANEVIEVLVPAYRCDVLHTCDMIEDVAIAYGYDKFLPIIPKKGTIGQESYTDIIINKLSNILVGLQLSEVNAFVLSSKENQIDKVNLKVPVIELKNPATQEYDCMRHWLTSDLLSILQLNKRHEYPQRMFLAGRCAERIKEAPGYQEMEKIAIALCADDVTFTSIKQILDRLIQQIGKTCTLKEINHPTFLEGRSGTIIVDKKEIGIIGEVHPSVLTSFELEMPVVILEINITTLLPLLS